MRRALRLWREIGRYRAIVMAVVVFLALNITTALFDFSAAKKVEAIALRVNLAGRQRMLSQKISKSVQQLVLAEHAGRPRGAAVHQLLSAAALFDETLTGFVDGGRVTDAGNRPAALHPAENATARALVRDAKAAWQPLYAELQTLLGNGRRPAIAELERLALQIAGQDGVLLQLMNRLTVDQQNRAAVLADKMRHIQTASVTLGTVNFLLILLYFIRHLRRSDAEIARTVAAWRQQQGLYQELVDGHDGTLVVRWHPDTTLTFVNRQYCQLQNSGRADLLGCRWLDLEPPRKREAAAAYVERLLADPVVDVIETVHTDAEGRRRWIRWSNQPVFNQSGELVEYQGLGMDITASKDAELALADSQQRFHDFATASSDWFWETDEELRFTWLSDSVEDITGAAPEWHYGKTRAEIGRPDSVRPDVWQAHMDTMAARQPFRNFEYCRRGPRDDRWLRTSGVPVFDRDGEFRGYRGVASDITALHQTQIALRESERQFRALFQQAAIGIVLVDPHGKLVAHNPSLQKMLGYSETELQGIRFNALSHPEDAAENDPLHAEVKAGKRASYQLEKRYLRRDGSTLWARTTVSMLPDEQGQPKFMIGMIEDITAQKTAATEREAVQRQLINASRSAGQAEIAVGVLHNVGNILNSLNTSVTLVGEKIHGLRAGGLAKAVALLHQQRGDLARFIDQDPRGRQLPDYLNALSEHFSAEQQALSKELQAAASQIEHIKAVVAQQQGFAKRVAVIEKVRLKNLLDEVLQLTLGAHSNIEIERDYRLVPDVVVDKHRLLQILINLLNNAKQALAEPPADQRRIRIGIGQSGPKTAQISVRDNGVGIETQQLAKIFTFGFTTKTTGHGFGLHASANTAAELGGKLSCRSDGPGQGAEFVLQIPLTPQTTPADDEPPAATASG